MFEKVHNYTSYEGIVLFEKNTTFCINNVDGTPIFLLFSTFSYHYSQFSSIILVTSYIDKILCCFKPHVIYTSGCTVCFDKTALLPVLVAVLIGIIAVMIG